MGRLEAREIVLCDGTTCLLRSAEVADAAPVLAYRRAQIGSHEFEINLPREFDLDPAKQREMIQESLDKDNWLYILALASSPPHPFTPSPPHPVGGLIFRGQAKRRVQHHGTFGIAVDAAWRGRGVGRAMISALLDWAAAHPTLEKITLGVFANNTAAQALYRSLGFIEEGRSLRHFRMDRGRYIDDVTMCLYVKPGVAPRGFNTWRAQRARGAGRRRAKAKERR